MENAIISCLKEIVEDLGPSRRATGLGIVSAGGSGVRGSNRTEII